MPLNLFLIIASSTATSLPGLYKKSIVVWAASRGQTGIINKMQVTRDDTISVPTNLIRYRWIMVRSIFSPVVLNGWFGV